MHRSATCRALAQATIRQLQDHVRELLDERRAFVEGGMLERRRLTRAWEAELRDAGLVG